MKKFFEIFGGVIIAVLVAVGVIGGLGFGVYSMDIASKEFQGNIEMQLINYQAKVDLATYGTKFDGYVKVCESNGVPVTVCVLAWPNGARK